MNWSSSYDKPADATNSIPKDVAPPEVAMTWDDMDQDALLMTHKQMQDDLSSLKAKELELRKYIVNRAFPQKEEGTNTLELGNGYELKAVVRYNYKLADNDIVEKTLQLIAEVGNEGPFIADRLVSWTPNFLKTEYTKLQEDAAAGNENAKRILKLIEVMLEITDAAPTLTIKAPKGDKK
jgi:hypothetical protein